MSSEFISLPTISFTKDKSARPCSYSNSIETTSCNSANLSSSLLSLSLISARRLKLLTVSASTKAFFNWSILLLVLAMYCLRELAIGFTLDAPKISSPINIKSSSKS